MTTLNSPFRNGAHRFPTLESLVLTHSPQLVRIFAASGDFFILSKKIDNSSELRRKRRRNAFFVWGQIVRIGLRSCARIIRRTASAIRKQRGIRKPYHVDGLRYRFALRTTFAMARIIIICGRYARYLHTTIASNCGLAS